VFLPRQEEDLKAPSAVRMRSIQTSFSTRAKHTCSQASRDFRAEPPIRREGAFPQAASLGPATCTHCTLAVPPLSGCAAITQPIREQTKVTLAPPLPIYWRTQGLSGASEARVRDGIQAGDSAPIALLAAVRNSLGPLSCFQGKVSTLVTVPGSRPARDLGLHLPLASSRRDARGGGASSAVCGMPRAGVFWKQYRAVRSGLLRARPLAAAAAPARATRFAPQPGERRAAGGRAELDRTSSGKWGAELRCAWGPGKGLDCGHLG
jgi:hypothetical protein